MRHAFSRFCIYSKLFLSVESFSSDMSTWDKIEFKSFKYKTISRVRSESLLKGKRINGNSFIGLGWIMHQSGSVFDGNRSSLV